LVIFSLAEYEEGMENDYVASTSTQKMKFLEEDEPLNQILDINPYLGR